MTFVHLRVRSEFSLIDSLLSPQKIAKLAKKYQMPAVAITDLHNFFAAVPFFKACIQAQVAPILGADLRYFHQQNGPCYRGLFLCMNEKGYQNLNRLITAHFRHPSDDFSKRAIAASLIEQYHEGLIFLSGGISGDANDHQNGEAYLQHWQNIFGERYFLEIQRLGEVGENQWVSKAVEFSQKFNLHLVATHEVIFEKPDNFQLHNIRSAISLGEVANVEDESRYKASQFFQSEQQMRELFRDLPQAVDNTVAISKLCQFELPIGAQPQLPRFDDDQDEDQILLERAAKGLSEKVAIALDLKQEEGQKDLQHYKQRLQKELEVIKTCGYAGYFLIVADYVNWAHEKDIPVGPGRGSGVGSLVAYCLGIISVDPMQYDLLFERFLNPDRASLPDFDIDFCAKKRKGLFEYIQQRYGKESVAHIVTIGTMKTRKVVRDVSRALGLPVGLGNAIVNQLVANATMKMMISDEDKVFKQMEIEEHKKAEGEQKDFQALKEQAHEFVLKTQSFRNLYQADAEVREVVDMAILLEGLASTVGIHAAGVIISNRNLLDVCPLYYDQSNPSQMAVIHFDMGSAENVGLVKFDFLGLKALTLIDETLVAVERSTGKRPQVPTTCFDNAKVFSLMKRGLSSGLFQLESDGMKRLLKSIEVDSFDDLVAALALMRPGPLGSGMDKTYVRLKFNQEKEFYIFPELQELLGNTRGVLLFQEQVMLIAQRIANFSLSEADTLRKAMGKKDASAMEQQREPFIQAATQKGFEHQKVIQLFEMMEKFAAYGFNKSHTVAYAVISYQTAWLKKFYPAYFVATNMTLRIGNDERLKSHWLEKSGLKLDFLPPDVNRSFSNFHALDKKTVIYGLSALKGVGHNAAEAIVHERDRKGLFQSFEDFLQRCHAYNQKHGLVINKRAVEALIEAGALDGFEPQTRLAKKEFYKNFDYKNQRSDLGNLLGGIAIQQESQTGDFRDEFWYETQVLSFQVFGFDVGKSLFEFYASDFSFLIDFLPDIEKLDDQILQQKRQHWVIARLLQIHYVDEGNQEQVELRISQDRWKVLNVMMDRQHFSNLRFGANKKAIFAFHVDFENPKKGRCLALLSLGQFRQRFSDYYALLDQRLKDQDFKKLHDLLASPKLQGDCRLKFFARKDQELSLWQLNEGFFASDQNLSVLAKLIGGQNIFVVEKQANPLTLLEKGLSNHET